jgi:hypothetical protein
MSSFFRWRSGAFLVLGLALSVAGACTSSSSDPDASGGGGTTGGASGTGGAGASDSSTTGGGSGGAGATGGSAGAEAGPSPALCNLTCTGNSDCVAFVNNQPYDLGLSCTNGSCFGCSQDSDCVRPLSGWLFPCTTNAECAVAGSNYVCVDAGGQGRCAKAASTDGGGCSLPDGPEVVQMPLWGTVVEVGVCGHQETAWCKAGHCAIRCIDSNKQPLGNAVCLAYVPGTTVCNVTTGQCECNLDNDCGGVMKCVDGHCGCKTDTDCTGSVGPHCVQGYCSCSDSNECATVKKGGFDLLAPACQTITP